MNQRLKGKDIYLRPMTEEDTDNIVRWRNSHRVKKNFIYQTLFTNQGHLQWFKENIDTGKTIQFIICENNEDRPIGCVNLKDIDLQNKKAEFGIYIGEEDAEGKGIGTEAAILILDYAFSNLSLHKIMLRVLSSNHGAIRSYEKAGFEKEAYLKDDVLIHETYQDIILMGIINPKERE